MEFYEKERKELLKKMVYTHKYGYKYVYKYSQEYNTIFAVIYRKSYLLYKIKVKRDTILTKQNYYIDDNTVRKISSPQNTPSRQNVEEI